jgi:hypothetical protein
MVTSLRPTSPDYRKPCTAWTAEPEARVRFDEIGGEPANVDLLVRAEDGLGPLILPALIYFRNARSAQVDTCATTSWNESR